MGSYNKLGNHVFVRFATAAGNRTLTLAPLGTGTNLDFRVVDSNGQRYFGTGSGGAGESRTFNLSAGEHVAALTDSNYQGTAQQCFNFTVN